VTETAAAIYCRISNDADGRMLRVTRQERSWRRLDVARVFVDNDISSFSGASRPGYQQLLAELAEGAFAAVLAWDGDLQPAHRQESSGSPRQPMYERALAVPVRRHAPR
jgi:hypothetical protein